MRAALPAHLLSAVQGGGAAGVSAAVFGGEADVEMIWGQ